MAAAVFASVSSPAAVFEPPSEESISIANSKDSYTKSLRAHKELLKARASGETCDAKHTSSWTYAKSVKDFGTTQLQKLVTSLLAKVASSSNREHLISQYTSAIENFLRHHAPLHTKSLTELLGQLTQTKPLPSTSSTVAPHDTAPPLPSTSPAPSSVAAPDEGVISGDMSSASASATVSHLDQYLRCLDKVIARADLSLAAKAAWAMHACSRLQLFASDTDTMGRVLCNWVMVTHGGVPGPVSLIEKEVDLVKYSAAMSEATCAATTTFISSALTTHMSNLESFVKQSQRDAKKAEQTCAICLAEAPDIRAVCCGGLYHLYCLYTWLSGHKERKCPSCRSTITLPDEAFPPEPEPEPCAPRDDDIDIEDEDPLDYEAEGVASANFEDYEDYMQDGFYPRSDTEEFYDEYYDEF